MTGPETLVEFAPMTLRGLATRWAALPSRERTLLSDAVTGKRRAEFVAGRETARSVVARWLGCDDADVVIVRDPDAGFPVVELSIGTLTPPQLSISHAGGWCVAACGPRRIGIDLVVEEPQPASFVAEAFAPGELSRWARWLGLPEQHPRTIATAFAAKEAVLKVRRTGFAEPLHAVVVQPRGERDPSSAAFAIEVHSERTEELNATAQWRAGMAVFLATIPADPCHARLVRRRRPAANPSPNNTATPEKP